MSQWEGIATAPRFEGSKILSWNGHEVATVEYRAPYNHPDHIHHDEQWIQVSESGRATSFSPTHWMPLPEPPETSG